MNEKEMREMDRIDRIKHMEVLLDRAVEGQEQLYRAYEAYDALRADINELEAYYGSGLWREDYKADEDGLIPHDLKRGVLSEDGIWDMLVTDTGILKTLRRMVDRVGIEDDDED